MLFALSLSSAPLLNLIFSMFTTCSKARHVTLQATNTTNFSQRVSGPSPLNGTVAAPHIDCDEILYGRDLNMASCMTAILKIDTTSPTYNAVKTWGQRGTGDFDIVLPQRYMGRKYLSRFSKAHGVRSAVSSGYALFGPGTFFVPGISHRVKHMIDWTVIDNQNWQPK